MNFLISKDEMLAALNKCIGLATKGDSPLTENVKIDVGDEDITFTTSDRQSQIIASCPSSKIKTKGVTCVNAKKVNELFRLLPDKEDINVFLDGNKLKIKTTGGSWELSNFPSEDFPVFNVNNEDTTQVSITSQSLTDLISRTLISMPRTGGLNTKLVDGILFEFSNNEMSATTYDGHRISSSKEKASAQDDQTASCIVPRRAVTEISKIISGFQEDIKFSIGKNNLILKTKSVELKSSLILKPFVPYQTAINPSEFSLLKVNTKEFSDALNRASLLANSEMKEVMLTCFQDKIYIESLNRMSAEKSSESIDATYDGEEIQVIFNVRYLLDALSVMGSEITEIMVFFELNKKSDSVKYRWILKHEGKDHTKFFIAAIVPVVTPAIESSESS